MQQTTDLVTFTEEILNGKLHFGAVSEPSTDVILSSVFNVALQTISTSFCCFNR